MKKKLLPFTISNCIYTNAFICICLLAACNTTPGTNAGAIATDTLSIAQGHVLFEQNCSACHNFRLDGIGPSLAGVTNTMPATWIKSFIHNPKAKIEAGDRQAQQLFQKYHTIMPSFSWLNEDQLNQLVAFLHSQKKTASPKSVADAGAIKNPIPEPVAFSGVTANLELVTTVPH